jgi:hypothetical protein
MTNPASHKIAYHNTLEHANLLEPEAEQLAFTRKPGQRPINIKYDSYNV